MTPSRQWVCLIGVILVVLSLSYFYKDGDSVWTPEIRLSNTVSPLIDKMIVQQAVEESEVSASDGWTLSGILIYKREPCQFENGMCMANPNDTSDTTGNQYYVRIYEWDYDWDSDKNIYRVLKDIKLLGVYSCIEERFLLFPFSNYRMNRFRKATIGEVWSD